jgi:signal transduction histidine kinase
MIDLIGLTDLSLNLLFALYFPLMLLQCLLFYLSLKDAQPDYFLVVFEGQLLLILTWVSWFIATLKDNVFIGIILLPGPDLRLAFLSAILTGLWLMVRHRQTRPGLVALILLMLLPVFDQIAGGSIGLRLAVAGVLINMFSLVALFRKINYNREKITSLSIKDALDLLPDGMLFAKYHGQPVSINRQAREIIEALGLSPDDRFDLLWARLAAHPDRVRESDDQDDLMIGTRDGRYYYFSKFSFSHRRRSYNQLHLRDVTKEIDISQQIRNENRNLAANAIELQRILELAEDNARRKAILESRARLHDILSQRLSLTRVLLTRLEKDPDQNLLDEIKKLLTSIGYDLFYEPDQPARARFTQLVQIYQSFGIDVACAGTIPTAEEIADIFVKVLREAFSNALRHAGASQISVHLSENEAGYQMIIANDGYCPNQLPHEGNGIHSIRSRLERVAGRLEIVLAEKFTLIVSVPSGDDRVFSA